MLEVKKYILGRNLGLIKEDLTFKELTTLRIGGKISLVYYPYSLENFIDVYRLILYRKVPFFIIGGGSNILASDKKYEGIVISFSKIKHDYIINDDVLECDSGIMANRLSYELAMKKYTGLEFLSGIPGSIGGVVAMNASYKGRSISDQIISVDCVDNLGRVITLKNNELEFEYRNSKILKEKLVVIKARFKVTMVDEDLLEVLKYYQQIRNETQPLGEFSAGCAFKNPKEGSAWRFIEEVGLRGFRINDAVISEKHANFVINSFRASSEDMIELLQLIKEKVKKEKNINLINEWILVNFD